jgi:fused-like protein
LDDRDPKTRANVAGAIGNLIRNGGRLSSLMSQQRIPEKLMHIIVHDRDIQPKKTALFSLGTMAVFPTTR